MKTPGSLAKPRRWVAQLFVALSLVVTHAAAQPGGPEPQPVPGIVPPRVLSDTSVEYPEQATGDMDVVLELLVGRDGSVEALRVVRGDEPFASRALRAAKNWRFEAAAQNGVRARARIRMLVSFKEPEPPAPPAEKPARPATPAAPAAPEKVQPQQPIEVVVTGERAESEAPKRLSKADVRQLPGAFGDPFRAIEVLPGVTPIASGLPYFFVRGAPPGNVGYFFDGIAVPGLYHVAAGPAVIHPSFVEEVKLYSGAYPARYGRISGGIVASSAAPPQRRFRGEASVRLVDSGALVEAPFADGRGSATFAGRYSYTGALLSLIFPEVNVGYWDYQGRVDYRLTERDSVSVFGFGAYDFLSAENDEGVVEDIYDVTFHRLDLRYNRVLSSKSALRNATTLGLDRASAGGELELRARRVRNRVEYTNRLEKTVLFRAGADVELARFDARFDDSEDDDDGGGGGPPPELSPNPLPGLPPRIPVPPNDNAAVRDLFKGRSELDSGFWLESVLGLGSGVTLTPGFRLDLYTSRGVVRVAPEPRISARFQVSRRVALLHDLGLAHQPPSFAVPVPGLQGDPSRGLQTGVQSSAGTEIDLGNKVTGTFSVFQNILFGATDPLGLFQLQRADAGVDNQEDRATAHSYGFEVFIKRSLSERLGGFISYTLSRSDRSVGRLKGPSSFDRTHVLNLALAYDLGRAWRVGGRVTIYTGIPAELAYPAGVRQPPRTPTFYRLDWRLEKRWRLGKTGFWALVFEVLNTTLNKETLDMSCYAYGCTKDTIGPITIPSIGLEASF